MIFSEFPYARVDMEAIAGQLKHLTGELASAQSFEEADRIFRQKDELVWPDAEKEPIKAFISVRTLDGSRQYESTRVLIQTEDGREALRREALHELIIFKCKYKTVLKWINAEKYVDDLIALLDNSLLPDSFK